MFKKMILMLTLASMFLAACGAAPQEESQPDQSIGPLPPNDGCMTYQSIADFVCIELAGMEEPVFLTKDAALALAGSKIFVEMLRSGETMTVEAARATTTIAAGKTMAKIFALATGGMVTVVGVISIVSLVASPNVARDIIEGKQWAVDPRTGEMKVWLGSKTEVYKVTTPMSAEQIKELSGGQDFTPICQPGNPCPTFAPPSCNTVLEIATTIVKKAKEIPLDQKWHDYQWRSPSGGSGVIYNPVEGTVYIHGYPRELAEWTGLNMSSPNNEFYALYLWFLMGGVAKESMMAENRTSLALTFPEDPAKWPKPNSCR